MCVCDRAKAKQHPRMDKHSDTCHPRKAEPGTQEQGHDRASPYTVGQLQPAVHKHLRSRKVCLTKMPAWTETSRQVSTWYQSSDQRRQGPASEDRRKPSNPTESQQASRNTALYPLYKNISIQSLHKKVLAAAAMQTKNHQTTYQAKI